MPNFTHFVPLAFTAWRWFLAEILVAEADSATSIKPVAASKNNKRLQPTEWFR